MNIPRLTLAALRGGSGKTTISLGLIAAWREQGRNVLPFKKGPDYIDAGWLAQAAQRPCYNLDPFLMKRELVKASFYHRCHAGSDLAVIEGARGLYDGADEAGTYSTAELAKLLKSPTILIVDCTKATRTLAAIVYGCLNFDPALNLAGVILNEVATGRQETLVRRSIEKDAGVKVLGAMPRVRTHELPERHLGLVPHQEHPMAKRVLDHLKDLAAEYIDLDALLKLAESAPELTAPNVDLWPGPAQTLTRRVRIGVIRDSVFQFYYPENIEALERLVAEIVVFSALEARRLPQVEALYLGGGFPETQAELLSCNQELRDDIWAAAEKGLPIYAECGGLMYLGKSLYLNGKYYPMAGVFPVSFCLEKKPQGHGYTKIAVDRENTFFPIGCELIGHEFHYSRPMEYNRDEINLVFKVNRGHGFDNGRDGLAYKNVLASYTHLHALSDTHWAESLIRTAGAESPKR